MANFDEVKTGGWVNGEEITGAQQTGLQSRLVKAVNGDDGSSHAGVVTLGGLTTSHHTDKYLLSGPHSGASISISWDFAQYSFLDIVRSRSAAGGTITLAFSNIKQGDRYLMLYRPTTPDPGGTGQAYDFVFGTSGGTIFHTYEDLQAGSRTLHAVGICNGAPFLAGAGGVVGVGESCSIPLPVDSMKNEKLTGLKVRIDPANNTLPTTNVKLQLISVAQTDGTETVVATVTDALTGASYQAVHDLTLSLTDVVLDPVLNTYYLNVLGEVGGDADAVTVLSAHYSLGERAVYIPRATTGITLWEARAISNTRLFWRKLMETESGPFF